MFKLIPLRQNRKSDHIARSEEIFDQFFDNFFRGDVLKHYKNTESICSSFKVDVIDATDRYILVAELPGIIKENVTLSYEANNLTISAIQCTSCNQDVNYIRKERYDGEFQRTFYVDNIQADSIDARFENGILYVTLMKNPIKSNKKNIEIK